MARMPRSVRRTFTSIVVMLILIVAGGIAYVYYADRNTPKKTTADTTAASYQAPSIPKPHAPQPTAAEQAAVESVYSPVAIGQNTSITIQTNIGSTCTIAVTYNNVPAKDSGLAPKHADDWGNVTWAWTINSSVPVGNWPIKVLCTYTNGKTAMVESAIQVTK